MPVSTENEPVYRAACIRLDEQILAFKIERESAIQGLVIPVTVSFSAREAALVSQRLEQIKKSGFDLEQFGGSTYMIRGVPAALKPADAEPVLRDMVQELVDLSVAKHLLVRPDRVLITAPSVPKFKRNGSGGKGMK